jgi:hypothetical protein
VVGVLSNPLLWPLFGVLAQRHQQQFWLQISKTPTLPFLDRKGFDLAQIRSQLERSREHFISRRLHRYPLILFLR